MRLHTELYRHRTLLIEKPMIHLSGVRRLNPETLEYCLQVAKKANWTDKKLNEFSLKFTRAEDEKERTKILDLYFDVR